MVIVMVMVMGLPIIQFDNQQSVPATATATADNSI
jgi:hypothetical protein